MKTVAISQSSVNIPEEIEISDYQWHLRINARFRTSSERFRITYKAREANEPEEIVVSSFSRDWLLRNAMSTLASVEVEGPISARSMIAEKCRQTLELYENGKSSK